MSDGPAGSARRKAEGIALAILVAASLGAAGWGTWALARYSLTPGAESAPPATWPAQAGPRASDRPTLLLFAHARCPCSRASLAELDTVLKLAPARLDARVVLYRPAGDASPEWSGDLWERAGRLDGVSREWDEDGRLAKLFGVTTSGHVLVHDEAGNLTFSGGITPSRGHAGDGPGRQRLLAALRSDDDSHAAPTPVFGCSIRGRTREDS